MGVKPCGTKQAQQNAGQPSQIQARIPQNLQAAGFTAIHMMPSSFMVRAKDKDGNPVMMVINPNSIEAVTFEGGANNNRTAGQDSAIQQPELRPGQSAVWPDIVQACHRPPVG